MALFPSGPVLIQANSSSRLAWNFPLLTAAAIVPMITSGGTIDRRIEYDQLEVRIIQSGTRTQYRMRVRNLENTAVFVRLAINTFGVISL